MVYDFLMDLVSDSNFDNFKSEIFQNRVNNCQKYRMVPTVK